MEKYSKKLVSKCIYIQILKCTETDLLGQFMAAGGWNLVHNWLRDGETSSNWPFVQELLEMLLLCPVDGNRLKSNHTPKIVKNLSLSCPHQHVRILSSKLVEQWLKIAHQEKQLLAAANGMTNGNNGMVNSGTTEMNKLSVDTTSLDNKVNESLQNGINGQVSDTKSEDENNKKSSENVKYKVSNKEGSGKLLLSLKRSTSPSVDEKDSKQSRSSSVDSKSKSSSSEKEKDRSKKSSSSSSHKSSSSSSKSSHRDKERSSSSHHKSSSSSSRHSSSSKSSSSKSSSSSSRDKDRDKRKKDEKSQAEKDKETLDLLAPMSSSKLQRIPKRQHSENGENKSSESNKDSVDPSPSKVPKTETVEKKKPSISIEVRKGEKPKTVKTLNSQFRNHGLAEEPPKPPSRKDLKKPSSTPAISIPTQVPLIKASTSPPPSKKLHLEKTMDVENVPERVGGIKLIKPKRKYFHINHHPAVLVTGAVLRVHTEWFFDPKYFHIICAMLTSLPGYLTIPKVFVDFLKVESLTLNLTNKDFCSLDRREWRLSDLRNRILCHLKLGRSSTFAIFSYSWSVVEFSIERLNGEIRDDARKAQSCSRHPRALQQKEKYPRPLIACLFKELCITIPSHMQIGFWRAFNRPISRC